MTGQPMPDHGTEPKPARRAVLAPKLFTTLKTYRTADLVADLVAGLTVAMVALPLSLAIAIASGAEPGTGVTTAIIAGFLISFFGGSRVQIGGPTGAFIVVVYGVIETHGYDGLVLATLMAGVILMVAALFRAGSLIRLVPEAVINGFTVGIAIIIAASQIKDFFGLTADHVPADLIEKLVVLAGAADTLNPVAAILGLGSIAVIVALRAWFPRLPGLLLAVVLAAVAVRLLALPVDTITSRYGALPASLPAPHLALPGWERLVTLLPSALVIAFLAGVESLLSAIVADRMSGGHHRPNAEIMAQGIANCGSALFGGLPATGAIARTATNVRAGGRTPVAGMAHAAFLLVFMMVAAPLAGLMPLPALAALLLVAAWNMAEVQVLVERLKGPRADAALMVLTLVLTAFVDLTVAIGVGVIIGLALRLRRRNVPDADWTPPER